MNDNQTLEVPTKPTSSSGTNILQLNSYCLDEIFSSKCLSVADLCFIGKAHSCLKDVVDGVFAKRHKKYIMTVRGREQERRTLRNFGALISELTINVEPSCATELLSEYFDWLIEYCGDTLQSLCIFGVKITEAQTIKLKPLFHRLQKVSLVGCDVYAGKTLLSNCESLVELQLGNVDFDDQHLALANTFPKLDRFEFKHWTMKPDSIDLIWNEFLWRHKNLKALKLSRKEGISHLLPMVANNCKQLVELNIQFEELEDEVKFENALGSILTFDHLNKLEIGFHDRNITKFVQKLKHLQSLEFLTLRWFVGDSKLVPALSKLTKLRSLELIWSLGLTNLNPLGDLERLTKLKIDSFECRDFDLVPTIKRLINLKTLYFNDRSFQMDKRMCLKIVDVLRERPGILQKTLQITCHTAKDFDSDLQFDEMLRVTTLGSFNNSGSHSDSD